MHFHKFLKLAGEPNILHHSKVITTDLTEAPEHWGFPNESFVKVYNDYPLLKIIPKNLQTDQLKVVYVIEENEEDIKTPLQLVSIFNQLITINVNIICSSKYSNFLKKYSNQNIEYFPSENITQYVELEVQIIIAHSSLAIHFLKQQIPMIIAGPNGFGGWVTPQNFSFLKKNGFSGRAGGTFGEIVPVELVAHEILAIKECKNIESILFENKELADNLPYRPLSEANKIIESYKHKEEQWRHLQYRRNMKPFIASNILFKEAGNTIMVTRKFIHDTLCTISQDDLPFLQQMNGKITCEVLCNNSQLEENEFWEMMYALNGQRIILY